jgi:hypothetical protein
METKENSQWDGVQLIVNCSPYLVKIFSPALWVNTFAQIPFERSGAFKTSVLIALELSKRVNLWMWVSVGLAV